MNWKDEQRLITNTTEREASPLLRNLIKQYASAREDITAELERIYGRYLTTTNPADYYNIMIQYDRLNVLLRDVQDKYTYYAKIAGQDITEMSTLAMSNVYYRQQYMLSWFTPKGINLSFSILDHDLIELTVSGTADSWKKIAAKIGKDMANTYMPQYGSLSQLLDNNRVSDLVKIQKSITQGFIQGKSIGDMSGTITTIFETSEYQATRIAETEFTRCANSGNYSAMQDAEEQGVKLQRMWVATLDSSTRDTHQELDGTIVGMDEPFKIGSDEAMYPGDFAEPENSINCRCTVISLVDGDQPELRRGRNPDTGENEVFDFKNYKQWMDGNNMYKNDKGQWVSKFGAGGMEG